MQVEALTAALQRFEVAVGGPGMKDAMAVLGALTGDLNAVSGFAKEHATVTSIGLDTVATALAGIGVPLALLSGPAGLVALAVGIEQLGRPSRTFHRG